MKNSFYFRNLVIDKFLKLSYFVIKNYCFKFLIEVYFKILSVNFTYYFFLFSTSYVDWGNFLMHVFWCLIKFSFSILNLSIMFLLTMVKLLLRDSYKNLEYFILI